MAEREFLGGITNTVMHFEDGKLILEDVVDAEPIMDYAAAARNNRFSADVCDGMLRHEAEIPMPVFQEECRLRGLPVQGILGTPMGDEIIESIIRNPKYAKFRASPHQRDPRIRMKGLR